MNRKMIWLFMIGAIITVFVGCENKTEKIQPITEQTFHYSENNTSVTENQQEDEEEEDKEEEDKVTEIPEEVPVDTIPGNSDVDVDLTVLSSTMVYSEVYNMIYEPEKYVGKVIRMEGQFTVYTNQDESKFYPAVIIADATACCSQGLEFILDGNKSYPDDYPKLNSEITVVGTFEVYEEEGNKYCHLVDAKIE